MNIFKLPDLGEGLQEAEIVEWHVRTGDTIKEDQNLVSVETAKAIVELPCPQGGVVSRLFGEAGDIINVGDPLVEFDGENDASASTAAPKSAADAGTVVGKVEVGQGVVKDRPSSVGHGTLTVKATPAVRALAQRMDVDLGIVTPSGPDGMITAADVQRVSGILKEVGPLQILRGSRRSMARTMTQSHEEIVDVTIMDDADLHAWAPADQDYTIRLIRAIVAGARSEPALNAWYDSHAVGRRVLEKIHLGIAVDTPEGLFVPILRDVGNRDEADLRKGLDAIKQAVLDRSIPPEEMRGNTITLSNFGTFAGRYASPIVVPPTVAILASGRTRDQVVAADGQPAVHPVMPLSLTFDHRAVTGGEAARFLGAVIADLQKTT